MKESLLRDARWVLAVCCLATLGCRGGASEDLPGGSSSASAEVPASSSGLPGSSSPASAEVPASGSGLPGSSSPASADAAASGSGLPGGSSPAEPDRTWSIEAQRPDTLRAALASEVAEVVLVDVRALAQLVVQTLGTDVGAVADSVDDAMAVRIAAALGDPALAQRLDPVAGGALALAWFDDGAVVALLPRAGFAAPPAEGGAPVSLGGAAAVAAQSGLVLLGSPSAIVRTLNAPSRLDLASDGDVYSALPPAAFVTWIVRNPAQRPGTQAALTALGLGDASAAAAAWAGDGSVTLTVNHRDPEHVSRVLGGAQVMVSQTLGELQRTASAELQGGVGWLSLASRGLWSRVTLAQRAQTSVVTIAPPLVGGPLRNASVAALAGAAVAAAQRDPEAMALPFVRMQASTARCADAAGAPPRVPVGLAVHVELERDGVLALFDLAATARAVLASGAGLLPFCLAPDAVASAVGSRFLGLAGVGDAEGSGAAWFTPGEGAQTAFVLPPGVPALAGPGDRLGRLVVLQGQGPGAVLLPPGVDPAMRLDGAASPTRARALSVTSRESYALVHVDAGTLAPLLATIDPQNAVRASIEASGGVVVAITPQGPIMVLAQVAANADALRTDLSPFVEALVRTLATHTGNPAGSQASLRALAAALDGIRIDVHDGVGTLRYLDGTRGGLIRLALALAAPTVGSALPTGGIDLEAARARMALLAVDGSGLPSGLFSAP